jgi:hypothetical protein
VSELHFDEYVKEALLLPAASLCNNYETFTASSCFTQVTKPGPDDANPKTILTAKDSRFFPLGVYK